MLSRENQCVGSYSASCSARRETGICPAIRTGSLSRYNDNTHRTRSFGRNSIVSRSRPVVHAAIKLPAGDNPRPGRRSGFMFKIAFKNVSNDASVIGSSSTSHSAGSCKESNCPNKLFRHSASKCIATRAVFILTVASASNTWVLDCQLVNSVGKEAGDGLCKSRTHSAIRSDSALNGCCVAPGNCSPPPVRPSNEVGTFCGGRGIYA